MTENKSWSRVKPRVINIICYALLIFFCIIVLLPFAWMLSSSFKLAKDVFTIPMSWLPKSWHPENYLKIFQVMDFAHYIFNSFKLGICVMVLQVFTSTFAAYGFARMRFKGRDTLFFCYIATIAIPWHAYLIPQFTIMRKLGLVDTHMGIVLMMSFTAYGVFLVRQFYSQIPEELSEAARIDGLSEYGIYFRIMLPLSRPVISTLAVFAFVSVWNDYTGSMIYLNSERNKTIQLGLRNFITAYSADYSIIMTGCVIAMIPVALLFLFLQRYLIEGIATTGMKG